MSRRYGPWLLVLLLVAGLAGCTTPPLTPAPGTGVTPREAVTGAVPMSEQVWGGVIVRVENLPEHTRLEVVGYPLRNQEPQTDRMTHGRFLLEVPEFLDPVDYRPGRRITARGRVERIEAGTIGEMNYLFPVLAANEVHLWPNEFIRERDPRVRFGIGIGIGL